MGVQQILLGAVVADPLSNYTGGLPFYNTTGSYGETKGSGYRTDPSAGTTDGTGLVLAMPGDVLTDEHDHVNTGSSAISITAQGNVTTSTSQSKFYGTSMYFDGVSDSISFTTSSDLSLNGDFTIEFWIYNNTITVDAQHPSPITMPSDGTAISQIYTNSSGYYGLYKSGDIVTTGSNSADTDVWQHVAFTRSGTTCYAFLNGVLKNTGTSSATFGGTSGTYRIGSYNHGGGDINAYMQDLRIYKGVAKYTSGFTVVPNQ